MKLLFCEKCGDLIKLQIGVIRHCECGTVAGRYWNKRYAQTNGEGRCISLNTHHLIDALRSKDSINDIKCWMLPHDGEHNPHTKVLPGLGSKKNKANLSGAQALTMELILRVAGECQEGWCAMEEVDKYHQRGGRIKNTKRLIASLVNRNLVRVCEEDRIYPL